MIISLIAAMDRNRVIGNNNQLPWYLPADLKHFKAITLNKPIIMGRKTYDSIGKPLPKRRNIVISHQQQLRIPGCEVFSSLDAALQVVGSNEEVMIIGGESLFRMSLSQAHRLYLTIIDHEFKGDIVFPEWDENEWTIKSSISHKPDEKNKYSYNFIELERI